MIWLGKAGLGAALKVKSVRQWTDWVDSIKVKILTQNRYWGEKKREFTDLENICKSYICVEAFEEYMKKSQFAKNKNITAKKYNRSLPREGMLGTSKQLKRHSMTLIDY